MTAQVRDGGGARDGSLDAFGMVGGGQTLRSLKIP